jgi:Tol biopolymer transport system component
MTPRLVRCAATSLATVILIGSETLSQPKLVGEGVISTADDETGFAITPDGKTAFFGKRSPATASPTVDVICVTHFRDGRWGEPEIAPFSCRYRDITPAVSPDGSKMFFASSRPSGTAEKPNFNIWYIELDGDWKTPKLVAGAVNSPAQEYGVSIAASGTLYFGSNRPGGRGEFDIYRSRLVNGIYQEPENLGPSINTEGSELTPAVSPDESLVVFAALGRGDEITGIHQGYNKGDLYVSHFENGAWSEARNAGPGVNSGAADSDPFFSADGKTLFFVSERGFATLRPKRRMDYRTIDGLLNTTLNGMGNVFEVDSRALYPARKMERRPRPNWP